MDTYRYAGVSEEYFSRYIDEYQRLCSKTLRVSMALLAGTVPQAVLYSYLLDALVGRLSTYIPFALSFPAWLLYLPLTFFNLPPPVTPRTFRRLLLLVACWSGAGIIVPVLTAPVWLRHARSPLEALILVTVALLLATLSIPTLLHHHRLLRQQELTMAK